MRTFWALVVFGYLCSSEAALWCDQTFKAPSGKWVRQDIEISAENSGWDLDSGSHQVAVKVIGHPKPNFDIVVRHAKRGELYTATMKPETVMTYQERWSPFFYHLDCRHK